MLRYRCLVLDHDDTTVDSTRTVNYPQFLEALAKFRPGFHMSLEEYMLHCFDPGFYEMCEQVLHYTAQEMADHFQMWKDYHKTHHPKFFPGMADLIRQQKKEGGYVCVVSHSSDDVIMDAYTHENVPLPDLIFGAEQPAECRKPNAWPLLEIMRRLDLTPADLLVVDDMPLGATMAQSVGVRFSAAGWCGMLPQIERHMHRCTDLFFRTIEDLQKHLFHETAELQL